MLPAGCAPLEGRAPQRQSDAGVQEAKGREAKGAGDVRAAPGPIRDARQPDRTIPRAHSRQRPA